MLYIQISYIFSVLILLYLMTTLLFIGNLFRASVNYFCKFITGHYYNEWINTTDVAIFILILILFLILLPFIGIPLFLLLFLIKKAYSELNKLL